MNDGKPRLRIHDRAETVEPLAHWTSEQGHLTDKQVGVADPSESIEDALARNCFDARPIARYRNDGAGIEVAVYRRIGSRPRQFALAVSYVGDDSDLLPDMIFAPHVEAYLDFLRAYELRAVEVESWAEDGGRAPGDCGARSACG